MAIDRNAQRGERGRVPEQVLQRMTARLEPPDPAKHAWERATVVLPAVELPPALDHAAAEPAAAQACNAAYAVLLRCACPRRCMAY